MAFNLDGSTEEWGLAAAFNRAANAPAARVRAAQQLKAEEARSRFRESLPFWERTRYTDEQIDEMIKRQALLASNTPQIRQGRTEGEEAILRQNGLLYNEQDLIDAQNLAQAHNASFFGSMVAPSISPELAASNPGYVREVVRGDASVLPNAFVSGLTFGTPSATAAAVSGARQGWQTAGNMAARAWNAATQGAKAAAPVVINPRWAAVTGAVTIPSVAEAVVNAGDGNSGSSEYIPLVLGATAGMGYGGFKGYQLVRKAGSWRALDFVTKKGKAIRQAAKATPDTRAVVPYVGTYTKPDWLGLKSFWERPVTAASKAGLPAPTMEQRVGAQFRNFGLRLPTYYTIGSGAIGLGLDFLQKGRHPDEPNNWFWIDKLTYPAVGIPKDIGRGVLKTMDDIQYGDSTETKNTSEKQSEQPQNPVVIVPSSPYVEGVNVDSLSNASYNIPYR